MNNYLINQYNSQSIWKSVSPTQYNTIVLFKDIFIGQKKEQIISIFSSDFGIHNGFSQEAYTSYEMEEFFLKCNHFGLNEQCNISCYDIGNNFIYFSLGKKDDCALFEGIFQWDQEENKLKGNGYHFKIEPKIQFITHNNQKILKRRINITPPPDNKVKNIIIGADSENFQLIKSELQPHLGGNFYSIIYDLVNENSLSFWDKIKIFSENGIYQSSVLMRGTDHPLFMDNLLVSPSQYEAYCPPHIYPVVLYILLENGQEIYYKYPKERKWQFNSKIKTICLTDPLSFDWIVNY